MLNSPRALLTIFGLTVLASSSVYAANPINTEQYLRAFHENPKAVMNERLANRDEFGFVLPPDERLWPKDPIEDRMLLELKIELREKLCRAQDGVCEGKKKQTVNLFADITPMEELPKLLYAPTILRNLGEMDRQNLQLHVLDPAPWSESYWPVHKGGMARRYNDSSFPESKVWADNYAHYLARSPGSQPLNQKSPAEKYDLLIGDHSYTLTRSLWSEGNRYMQQYGKVPTWVGYCHGWAPASFMYFEPTKAVEVESPSGQTVRFTPTDVKALASLSWGEAPPPVGFIGDVCRKTDVKQDANGRILDPVCFDVNPGAWHIGLVNQVGIQNRAMVMDSTFNREIWNFPINGYRYKYFNPQTLRESPRLAGAMIPLTQFTIDKFKKYRSPKAVYVVGIALDIGYSAELEPTTAEGPRDVKKKVVRFLYDLELNADKEIIGGEWYSNHHPDFVWNPYPVELPNCRPLSVPELSYLQEHPFLPIWNGAGPVSEEIRGLGERASRLQQPLHLVVDRLVRLSTGGKVRPEVDPAAYSGKSCVRWNQPDTSNEGSDD
jgi:hypothetical protein